MTEHSTTGITLDRLHGLVASDDYEVIRAGLSEVIALLEQPALGLNDSVRAYEVGRVLADRCQLLLDQAELRITQLDTDTGPSGSL